MTFIHRESRFVNSLASCCCLAVALAAAGTPSTHAATAQHLRPAAPYFHSTAVTSNGTVTIGRVPIAYRAVAGTLVVHAQGWNKYSDVTAKRNPAAEASMFYVAYFKRGAKPASRPITFLFNGGPGSSTVWLQMGGFGPLRVVTADHTHTPPAPYRTVNNSYSLLDVSDLVFIYAPGTGYGRIAGTGAKKAFYGVDQDIHAFAAFIREFLSRYGRWNSPKYLLGESYGTTRAAGLALPLEEHDYIDLNGIILLSCYLNSDLMPERPKLNPGIEEPYILALPTYAATAWYHHSLPVQPRHLRPLLRKVERFATTEYAVALLRGNALSRAHRREIAAKLHAFTGLPIAYLLRSNLRIDYGAFEKQLLAGQELTTGTLDSRFTGPTLYPLRGTSQYDPQSAAISSAYLAAWHEYVRNTLHFGRGMTYRTDVPIDDIWDYLHRPPGVSHPLVARFTVLPDLAIAMKRDPLLKVMVNGGYFDITTPFYEGWYEMHHLQIPAALQKNIEYQYYKSGHMIYVHVPALKQLHARIAAFIRRTDDVR